MIIEDGTGLTDSNSYVSVVFADNYFSSRGITEWDKFTEEEKENALIRGTDFIDNSFQWYGKKEFATQSLRFPRVNLYDYEGQEVKGVPNCLMQAVCDASLITASGKELFFTENENGDVISERIGDLAFTYAKTRTNGVNGQTIYDSINTKLRGLFKIQNENKILSGKVARV